MRHVPSGQISGRVEAPSSKSMMQRAVLAASLARGQSTILNPAFCSDALASLRVAESLGAEVKRESSSVTIEGMRKPRKDLLDCGESGLCFRISCALASLYSDEITVTAQGSLLKREQSMVVNPLRELGVECSSRDAYAPLVIRGPLRGGEIRINASSSSQFLSGLLMALPLCRENSTLKVVDLKSRPYVAMTLELLEEFGIAVDVAPDFSEFRITGGQAYSPCDYTVEGDWSGASFLLVAGALHGEISVGGLKKDSLQADREILSALKDAGADLRWNAEDLEVRKSPLRAFSFDASDSPDLFPPLVALACACEGKSRIKGISRLSGKESNRALTLRSEFEKLGASISLDGDWMEICGGSLRSAGIDSHNDHRIAMACAVAACGIEGGVDIEGEGCVAKSYPDFFEVLESLG